jgi:hypothetical protein
MTRYFLCVVLSFVLSSVLASCSTPATQPAPNPTPNQPTPTDPNQPNEPTPVQAASLLLAQQNDDEQNSPLALSSQGTKDLINSSTFYNGITVYLYMNDYSMSNKLMATDTFETDDFKYGPKGTVNNSQGLSLLSALKKDIYFWVSGNVPGDLYDDATWTRVANNFKALAQAANELNQQGGYSFKGIFFDDESSRVGGFFPFDCEVYGAETTTDTCATRQGKMAERGKQIMAAMLSVWPDLTWVQLHTPAVSVPGYDDTPLPSDASKTYGGDFDFEYEDYELAGPFFAGLAEAVHEAQTGFVVSGGNIYKLRNQRDFDAHESYVDTMGSDTSLAWLPASLNGEVWKTTVKVGFGVYNKDFPPLPPLPYKDLAVPAEKLKNARCTADELVFLYIEPSESPSANWYKDMPASWQALVQSSATCR